jgi:hypothetical protein
MPDVLILSILGQIDSIAKISAFDMAKDLPTRIAVQSMDSVSIHLSHYIALLAQAV